MSEPASQEFVLPPRQETFLARYPRNRKMLVTVVVLALLILPPAWMHGNQRHALPAVDMTTVAQQAAEEKTSYGLEKIDTDVSAPALNDQDDRTVKLVPAPDSRVTEDTDAGPLPKRGEDNLLPWRLYARPFNDADKRPRIAIVIIGLGMARIMTDQAISQLPPTVTLAFDAQAPVVAAWAARARQDGHEILLQVPMEPFDYPQSDPGPDTLLSQLPNSDNLERLLKIMRRASGYVGITTILGSDFNTDSAKFAPILQTLHDRGLMVLDARMSPHSVVTDMAHGAEVPVATVTERLDADLAPEAIATMLDGLEKTAKLNGRAIGITAATPIMITQLQAWTKALSQRGIALAPISAMVH